MTTPDGRTVSAAAEYWTQRVGVPFDRDVVIDVPLTPLDLNLDGQVDTSVQGKWELRGGILAHPELIGLVPTPDDPAGTVGAGSISTGFVGVRQERDPATGNPTGRFGFNCWLCHASADEGGQIHYGRPNTRIHLGLIMAGARVLDPTTVIKWNEGGPPVNPKEIYDREQLDATFDLDANDDGAVTIAEWRSALGMPPARVTQALLLLAGPGRLDQSIDHRMDGLIPLANLQQHRLWVDGRQAHLRNAHRRKVSLFNPVSIPSSRSGLGVAHYSWSGKDSSRRHDAVSRICDALAIVPAELAEAVGWRGEASSDEEVLGRVLTLDFRNAGTFGLETDTVAGMDFPGQMVSQPSADLFQRADAAYQLRSLRRLLTESGRPWQAPDEAKAADGFRIFCEVAVGSILNQRVAQGREVKVPNEYGGISALVPLDRSRPMSDRIDVRCITCHTFSPLAEKQPIQLPLTPLLRCDTCHLDHPDKDAPRGFLSLSEYQASKFLNSVEECLNCHKEHRRMGPMAWSNSWLLPFDADGDGATFGDEADDGAAGGMGTDAMLNGETLFVNQLLPPERRPQKSYLVSPNPRRPPERPQFSGQGQGWVRVAPLIDLADSAPYLHNGSVPTLEALLSPPAERPNRFEVGSAVQRFEFDTTLPGNHNGGHEFGFKLSPAERGALIAFLKSLGD